jgi:hypothetical protein
MMRGYVAVLTFMCLSGCHSIYGEPAVLSAPTIGSAPTVGTPQPQGPAFVAPGQLAAQPGVDTRVSKPVFIPVTNEDYAWEVIVDVVDEYFQIDQENRVQLVGTVMTEGRIETFSQVGATALEPNHIDSVGRYNLAESTFQSTRRRAEIRVVPQQGGYMVEAVVYKELEDLPRPENSTSGAASYRFDNSLSSRLDEQVSRTRLSNHWIPMGRDCDIEQEMLNEMQQRILNPEQ